MFKSIAKFFTGRHSSKQSNTNDQSIKLYTQEETPDNADAPFFSSTDVAINFARRMDKTSHHHYYDLFSTRIQCKVHNLESQKLPANTFVYTINEAEIPPKSVLAQLILDGFCLEYRDKQLFITLPISDIESEADKHLEAFMAQMKKAKLKEEQDAAEVNGHHEDDDEAAPLTDEDTASGGVTQEGNPVLADMKKMMRIQEVIGA